MQKINISGVDYIEFVSKPILENPPRILANNVPFYYRYLNKRRKT